MKIKLINQQSRKRIQQLNSRLKILASDIHGEDKLKQSHTSELNNEFNGLKKKNYFKSATNLHSHHTLISSNIQANDYSIQTNQVLPSSPKFSTQGQKHSNFIQESLSPKSRYSSMGWSQAGSVKEEMKAKKQLKQIIQSKKEFHSLIKKELSDLEKLEQMMIEQPESWDDQGIDHEEVKEIRDTRGQKEIGGERESQRRKEMIKYKQGGDDGITTKKIKEKEQTIRANEGQQFMKTKTQQSMQQSLSQLQNQLPISNLPNYNISPPLQSPSHSVQSSRQSQQNLNLSPSSHNNYHSLQQSPEFRKEQAEQLLREMMVIDFSEDNIQSVLRLVQEQSIRRSKKNSPQNSIIKQDNPSVISQNSSNHSSISNKNNSSLLSMVNSRQLLPSKNHNDHIKQSPNEQQEQEKHYQLIHSYKLLSLVLKIKHFSKLKFSLHNNCVHKQKNKKAATFYEKNLLIKSFKSLHTHCQQSLQQQQMLFKIKSIYTQNMLKKCALKQLVFNSKYKTFKFLSAKLAYQQELKTKSQALNRLLSLKEQHSRLEEVSKLSEQINKRSMFRVIKERYEKIRETYQKYKLLKNVRIHRAWNHLFNQMRFFWVRKLIVNKDVLENEEGIDDGMNQNQMAESSSQINQKVQSHLNKYASAFDSHLSQLKNNSSHSRSQQSVTETFPINPQSISNETIIQFNEPIVLHVKKSLLQKHLSLTRRKFMLNRFIEAYQVKRMESQRQQQLEQKETKVVKNILARNRKLQLVSNLKNNLLTSQLNKKLQYFCNITIGSVPQSIQQNSQEYLSQELSPKINPLVAKYFKNHFIQKLKKHALKSSKEKLQKQVYYDTIYGGNLVKRLFRQWKIVHKQTKQERQKQAMLKEQVQKEQERLDKQKQHQSLAYNQLKEQQLRLKQQQQKLHEQQVFLRDKINKLKQQEEQLKHIQKQNKQQLQKQAQKQKQLLTKQENELKLRLEKLKSEELLRLQRLEQIEKQIEGRKVKEIEQRQKKEAEEKRIKQIEAQKRKQQYLKLLQISKKEQKLHQQSKDQQKEESLLSHHHSQHEEQNNPSYYVEQSVNSYEKQLHNSIEQPSGENSHIRQDSNQQEQSYHQGEQHHEGPEEDGEQSLGQAQELNQLQASENQSKHNSEHQQSDNFSEESDRILNQYFTNKKSHNQQQQSPQKSSQKSQHQQQSPSNLQQSRLESSMKMNDMMDWLGNKIGINESLKEDAKNKKDSSHIEYHVEQSHLSQQEDDSVFAHMLHPNQQQQETCQPSQEKQNHSSEQPQQTSEQQSEPQSQYKSQQSSHSSHSQQQLASSTSPSHLRLLSYAQNHHTLSVKRLIFNHIFKYQTYKRQQTYESNLLKTVFTSWKTFYHQKKSLKKYLQIYENIENRINQGDAEHDERETQRKRRQPRSLQRQKRNSSVKRYMSKQRTKNVEDSVSKNAKIPQKSVPQSQKVKYYPTSKEQKQQFQALFQQQ